MYYSIEMFYKVFLSSLGTPPDKTLERNLNNLTENKKLNIENLEDFIKNYLDQFCDKDLDLVSIRYDLESDCIKLNKKIIDELYEILVNYKRTYLDLIGKQRCKTNDSEKIKRLTIEYFIEPCARIIIMVLEKGIAKRISNLGEFQNTFFSNIDFNKNLYPQIYNNLLNVIEEKDYEFLKLTKELKIKDVTLYSKIQSIKNIVKSTEKTKRSDFKLNEFIIYFETEKKITNYQKEELLLSLYLARFYTEVEKQLKVKEKRVTSLKTLTTADLKKITQSKINELNSNNEKEYFIALEAVELFKNKLNNSLGIKNVINTFEINNTLKKAKIINYNLFRAYARYLNSIENRKEAINYYLKALKSCLYRGNRDDLEKIVNEGMILSSYCENKRAFNDFNKYSILFKFNDIDTGVGDDWKFTHYHNKYYGVFEPVVSGFKDLFLHKGDELLNEIDYRYPDAQKIYLGRKRTPLMRLAYTEKGSFTNYKDVILAVEKLVKKGADVNRINTTGETALMQALAIGNLEIATLLLNTFGIEKSINQLSIKYKRGAIFHLFVNLDMYYINIFDEFKDVLKLLLDKGADVNLLGDIKETTILNILTESTINEKKRVLKLRKLEILELIIKYKANPYIPDKSNETSLSIAFKAKDTEVLQILKNNNTHNLSNFYRYEDAIIIKAISNENEDFLKDYISNNAIKKNKSTIKLLIIESISHSIFNSLSLEVIMIRKINPFYLNTSQIKFKYDLISKSSDFLDVKDKIEIMKELLKKDGPGIITVFDEDIRIKEALRVEEFRAI